MKVGLATARGWADVRSNIGMRLNMGTEGIRSGKTLVAT